MSWEKSCDISTPICIYSITEHREVSSIATYPGKDGPFFNFWTIIYKLHVNVICYQEFKNYRSVFCTQMMFLEGFFCRSISMYDMSLPSCYIHLFISFFFINVCMIDAYIWPWCIFLRENNFQLAMQVFNEFVWRPTSSSQVKMIYMYLYTRSTQSLDKSR